MKRDGTESGRAERRRRHKTGRLQSVGRRFFGTPRRIAATLVVVLFVPIMLVQLFYSTTSLLPNTSVGPVDISGMNKEMASEKLDQAYATAKVPIYFSDSNEVVTQPTLTDLGYTILNSERVDAYSYPFWARLVPYSLFWYQAVMPKGEPDVTRSATAFSTFITERFGEDCQFEPENATIIYKDSALQVVDASRGGSCDFNELRQKLEAVSARLNPEKVVIQGTSMAPAVSTATAQKEYARLMAKFEKGVTLMVKDEAVALDTDLVAGWMRYTASGNELVVGVKEPVVTKWLEEKYSSDFTYPAGTTVVTMKDYVESSRSEGKKGSSLNTSKTIVEIVQELRGAQDTAKLTADVIEPEVTYKRTYSPANEKISAVMKKYADTHAGVYGVKMVELSGERRNASYNETKVFTTASTYKLFVAYSVLLRIESGAMKWTDASYGGLSVSTCFDRMIELSNNECSVWFLLKISYPQVTAEAHALGAVDTNFIRSEGISSTAKDEAHFLSLLYTGQILSQQSSRDRLITAMKGNVYRAGIPLGIPSAVVADKVGFLWGLLHDASIVYSKKGDYVLIILTDSASWANIAELAGEIEAVR